MIHLYLIRHAQSYNNALDDVRLRVCDPPLTELGHRQAEILAQYLSGQQLCGNGQHLRLVCSPMLRALQTARYLQQALGVTPEVWVDIHEHGGIYLDNWEQGSRFGCPGMTRSQILEQFPDYRLPAEITEQGWWQGGFEELWACQARAIKVANALRQPVTGDVCLIVMSHATFLSCLLKALYNLLPGEQMWFSHRNTGISHLHVDGECRLSTRYLNQIGHLPPGLVT